MISSQKHQHIIRIVIIMGFLILAVLGSYPLIRYLYRDPYETYTAVQKEDKEIGTMQHLVQDEASFYLSVYYPYFNIEKLDEAITQFRETQILTDLKQNSKIIINVDYESYDIYDAYISIAFHQKLMDEDGKQLKIFTTTINYDRTSDKIMDTFDVLRNDYLPLLKQMAIHANLDPDAVTMDQLDTFVLGKENVSFLFDHDMTRCVSLTFADHKNYIALTNAQIPSLYQKEPIQTATKDTNVDPDKPMLAFTFDDGPNPLTAKLMDAFDQYDANATFFMVGPNIEQNPELVKDMVQRGFVIGNHTWSHEVELTKLSSTQLNQEIYDTQDALFKACGKDARFLRAPYGSYDTDVVKASPMTMIHWGIDSKDWKSRNVASIKKEILNHLFDGAIILEHDIYDTSVEAAMELLPELKEQGYQIVGLDTLMKYRRDMLIKNGFIVTTLYE